jgi:enterochelin esterase-like enzyme
MGNSVFLCIAFFVMSLQTHAQDSLPTVVSGKIIRLDKFHSRYITERNIDIWLPEGYTDNIKYDVLYMHDGQMLFDPEKTWNKQAWAVDQVVTNLLKENKVRNFIVVGIWNDDQTRHQDYFPQKPFEQLTQIEKDSIVEQLRRVGRTTEQFHPKSDHYLKFIVEELKPHIDKNYSVHTGSNNTFIAGSSMGGLISLYAICEYPTIFGGAACMSTHWIGTFTLENNPIPDQFLNYLINNLPSPGSHKLYFDCGDQTLDAFYPKIQEKVDHIMSVKGYTEINWMTRYFPGENHSEHAWNKRLNIPLEFLFNK